MSKSLNVSKETASVFAAGAARNGTKAAGGGGDENHLCRSQARALIDEEVEKRPFHTKHAYFQAKQKAPNLLQDGGETDPLLFMERCSHNASQTADLLCLYWKERLDLFGLDRAFLPMILTGYGAMDKDDILMVKSGFPALLPNTSSGQLALFYDRRQCTPGLPHACRMRACFYYLTLLAQDKRSREQGVLALVLLVTPRNIAYDSSLYPGCRKVFNWALNLMPLKIARFHVFNIPPKPRKGKQDKGYIVNEVLSAYMNNITDMLQNTDEDEPDDPMVVHFDHGGGEVVKVMRDDIGFDLSAIPTSLGGTWDFAQSTKWCRERIAWERQQYNWLQPFAPAEEKKDSAHNEAHQNDNAKRGQEAAAPPLGLNNDGEPRETEEEKLAKKRALNAIHSRRKRERRRDEVQSLKDEKCHLTRENERLRSQQGVLESLLFQAQKWTASFSTGFSTSETTGDAHVACGFSPSLPHTPVDIKNECDLVFADCSEAGLPKEAAAAADHDPNSDGKNSSLAAAKNDDAGNLFPESLLDDLSLGTDFMMNPGNASIMGICSSPFGNDMPVDDEAYRNQLLGEDAFCLNADQPVFDCDPFPTGVEIVPTPLDAMGTQQMRSVDAGLTSDLPPAASTFDWQYPTKDIVFGRE